LVFASRDFGGDSKENAMETIGKNIELMQEMVQTFLDPPPSWIRKWQTEAEHVLFLAGNARQSSDDEQLRMLDAEAKRLVDSRLERLSGRKT